MTLKRALIFVLALAACREEVTQNTDPVELTPEAVGYFCQMNMLEHPGPKGQAHLEGLPGTPLFFSQIRDVVAYVRMPEQSHRILALWVSDMGAPGATWEDPGAANWIDATTAFYVVGAAIEGGMGEQEFVPFADRDEARAFAEANGGSVMRLAEIPDALVIPPEQPDTGEDPDYERRLRDLSDQTGG